MFSGFGAYISLFMAAFLAATLVPAQSEAGLAAFIISNDYSVVLLVLVASVGNTLGSVVNWLLGRGFERFSTRRWFPLNELQLERATNWYAKYGRWSLLLSWVPFIGDPITVVAGILREPLLTFVLIVGIAKTVRYMAVALVALNWI